MFLYGQSNNKENEQDVLSFWNLKDTDLETKEKLSFYEQKASKAIEYPPDAFDLQAKFIRFGSLMNIECRLSFDAENLSVVFAGIHKNKLCFMLSKGFHLI